MKPETALNITWRESFSDNNREIAEKRYDEFMKAYEMVRNKSSECDESENIAILTDCLDRAIRFYLDRHPIERPSSGGLSHDEYYYEWLEEIKEKENATLDCELPLCNEFDRAFANEYFTIEEIALLQCGFDFSVSAGEYGEKNDRVFARGGLIFEIRKFWNLALAEYAKMEDKSVLEKREKYCREKMKAEGERLYARAQEYMASGEWSEVPTYLEMAADMENPDAMTDLALAEIYGQYGLYTDIDHALTLLRRAAETSGRAAYTVCELHDDGLFGIEGAEALEMCKKAAELGEKRAEERLTRGFDTRPTDVILKERYENGDSDAPWQLYQLYDARYESKLADEWFDRALELGHPEALLIAAKRTAWSNPTLCDRYLRRAAEKGNIKAIKWLGELELYEDDDRFWKAAMKTEDGAQYDGETRMRHSRELGWYKLAAEAGDDEAIYNVSLAYYYGYPVERNYAESAKWAFRGADDGNTSSMYQAARLLEEGCGVERDIERAMMLYTDSAEGGNIISMMRLYQIYRDGVDGVEPNAEKATRYAFMSGIGRD